MTTPPKKTKGAEIFQIFWQNFNRKFGKTFLLPKKKNSLICALIQSFYNPPKLGWVFFKGGCLEKHNAHGH
jgi:hypothetical protein